MKKNVVYLLTKDDRHYVISAEKLQRSKYFNDCFEKNELFGSFMQPILLQNIKSYYFEACIPMHKDFD